MTITDLPKTATTFDAIDFGGYTPRGYDSSRISGVMTGIPIEYLFSGVWLTKPGQSGTSIVVRDSKQKDLGRIYVNSLGDPPVFRPTKA